jgi:hypothetical protein
MLVMALILPVTLVVAFLFAMSATTVTMSTPALKDAFRTTEAALKGIYDQVLPD